jgi:hypothetical protein
MSSGPSGPWDRWTRWGHFHHRRCIRRPTAPAVSGARAPRPGAPGPGAETLPRAEADRAFKEATPLRRQIDQEPPRRPATRPCAAAQASSVGRGRRGSPQEASSPGARRLGAFLVSPGKPRGAPGPGPSCKRRGPSGAALSRPAGRPWGTGTEVISPSLSCVLDHGRGRRLQSALLPTPPSPLALSQPLILWCSCGLADNSRQARGRRSQNYHPLLTLSLSPYLLALIQPKPVAWGKHLKKKFKRKIFNGCKRFR